MTTAVNFDLVILNGRVIDPETKLDAVRNVGINGGKIAAVTEEAIGGRETIDAKGNVVAPGFIDTEMTRSLPEKVREQIREMIPLGEVGKPEDIAHAVRFLCSPEAGYITGQVLSVDGGMHT